MKILFLIVLFLFFIQNVLIAQILIDANSNALTAGVAESNSQITNNPISIQMNPASIISDSAMKVFFGHGNRLAGVTTTELSISYPFRSFLLGMYIGSANVEDLELRDNPTSQPIGTFGAREFNAVIGGNFRLSKSTQVGLSFNHSRNRIFDDEQLSTSGTVGILYQTKNQSKIGLSIRNIDIQPNDSENFYVEINSGYQKNFTMLYGVGLTPSVNIKYRNEEIQTSSGLEISFLHILVLRSGYFFNHDTKHISFGVGVHWKGYQFDWSMTPHKKDLGNVTSLSLSLIIPHKD